MLGIIGGRVFDPQNGKAGDVGDIWVKDGRIVPEGAVSRDQAEIVDAAGLVVMAGGVDIHAHIVGGSAASRRYSTSRSTRCAAVQRACHAVARADPRCQAKCSARTAACVAPRAARSGGRSSGRSASPGGATRPRPRP